MTRISARWQAGAVAVGVGCAFFLLALASILLTRLTANVALLWVANAMLLAALCARPANERLGLVLACATGSFAATTVISPYSPIALSFVVANCGEALIAWAIIRRLGEAHRLFKSMRSIPVFVIGAGIVAPVVSGVVPVVALWLMRGADPLFTWTNWTIGHGLGALIGTPVALLVLGGRDYWAGSTGDRSPLGFLVAMIALIGVTVTTFWQTQMPLLFFPVLPLIVATIRFRFAGAAIGVFAIAAIGATATIAGHGPVQLLDGSHAVQLLFFQFYLAVLFLTAVPFATMMAENKRLADTVTASEARYRMIADNASDVMLTLDPDGTIRFASPSVREIGGFDPEALIGTSALALVAEEDRERVSAVHVAALTDPDQSHRVEYRGLTADGRQCWFEMITRAVSDGQNPISSVVSVVRDLSHRKAREADLERQATTDPMTGLLNRRAFQRRLAESAAPDRSHPAMFALLDLDHFKRVNDNWGHASGDAALLGFADILRDNLRSQDAIGRLGGEEFAILFPDLTSADALAACERVRRALERHRVVTNGGAFGITVSIGLAPVDTESTPEAVFRQADAALYRAKALGRNRSELADS